MLSVVALLLLSQAAGATPSWVPLLLGAKFTDVSQSPLAGAVPYAAPVTVTATLDAATGLSESVYLRYSTDNFANCVVLPMGTVIGALPVGTHFAATIPNLTGSAAKLATVRYYVFTSTLVQTQSCAAIGALQLGNNAGLNYAFDYGVSFESLSSGPIAPTNCATAIKARLAATPGVGENFYLRFTTGLTGDFNAAGATTLAMIRDGATATATIPAQVAASTVTYYAFSSTATTPAAAGRGADPATVLQYGRNGGANYRFVTPDAVSISALTTVNATCVGGNDAAITFTVGGGTPGTYAFELAADGSAFQPATAINPAGDVRYRIGGLVAGSSYQVRVNDGCGLPATTDPSAVISSLNFAPTATLSNSGPVCVGGSTTVSFQLDREAGKVGARYYSLRQLDLDGTAGFSPVRALHFEGAAGLAAHLSAVPNPFSSSQPLTLWVQSPLAAEVPLTITDVAGRLVRSQVLHLPAGASRTALPDLAGLPAGVYLVQLPLGGQPQHLRVVKE